MKITDYILSKTDRIAPEPEVTNEKYQMFNTGGVEVEVAEFLYSLTCILKPELIVETGTHKGISSLYMALGLEENGSGSIRTYEVIESFRQEAMALWKDVGMSSRIECVLKPSLKVFDGDPIDLLFLDSEPQFRFDELLHFWSRVKPGGMIIIHDLHYTLGKSNITLAGMDDWPYGPWEKKLGTLVKNQELQMIFLPSPRGFTVMQKTDPSFENVKFMRGVDYE
jgi:predicted O-methyltransferase YrrM